MTAPKPEFDVDELEREAQNGLIAITDDTDSQDPVLLALLAELRTLRARVGELEKLRCLSCGCEILFDGPPESAEELRGTNLYCEMCETPIEADEHRHQLETFREELASLRARAESAEAEVARLRKLFDDAGQGEHNVLALVDHYQRDAIAELDRRLAAEARVRELEAAEDFALNDQREALITAHRRATNAEARITSLESEVARLREAEADRKTCAECRDPEGCFANGTCYECAGLTFEEIMQLREEAGLEAKVREVLGERLGSLKLKRVFTGYWIALGPWGDGAEGKDAVSAETLPALLRAILEVERGGS